MVFPFHLKISKFKLLFSLGKKSILHALKLYFVMSSRGRVDNSGGTFVAWFSKEIFKSNTWCALKKSNNMVT